MKSLSLTSLYKKDMPCFIAINKQGINWLCYPRRVQTRKSFWRDVCTKTVNNLLKVVDRFYFVWINAYFSYKLVLLTHNTSFERLVKVGCSLSTSKATFIRHKVRSSNVRRFKTSINTFLFFLNPFCKGFQQIVLTSLNPSSI